MIPPIFPVCAASADVRAIFGADPVRIYPFGLVHETPVRPYAVWQVIPGGGPENYLGNPPDADHYNLQVDVYTDTPAELLAAARTLRNAIEPHAYITGWGNQMLDEETKFYRYSFDVSWIVTR